MKRLEQLWHLERLGQLGSIKVIAACHQTAGKSDISEHGISQIRYNGFKHVGWRARRVHIAHEDWSRSIIHHSANQATPVGSPGT